MTLASLTITSQDSPTIGRIVQGQLTIPKLLVFREGNALDYDGELTKDSIVETMLREYSRPSVQTLRTVKQTERFLHLDSWSAAHSDEEKPPRVVGFFPSNETAGYAVFRTMAGRLQGMITFGECFDPALQKKFHGSAVKSRSVIRAPHPRQPPANHPSPHPPASPPPDPIHAALVSRRGCQGGQEGAEADVLRAAARRPAGEVGRDALPLGRAGPDHGVVHRGAHGAGRACLPPAHA